MNKFRPNLSDDPKDLEGAAEWALAEIERMEKEEQAEAQLKAEEEKIKEHVIAGVGKMDKEEKSQKVLMEHMRPFIMEIAEKRGLVEKREE